MPTLSSEKTPGRYGAKRQSWIKKNPRDVLRRILASTPNASEKEVMDEARDLILADEAYVEAIFKYWFANNYRAYTKTAESDTVIILRQRRPVQLLKKERVAKAEQLKTAVRIALMEHVLTNGKMVRDSTFGDCKREGGWLLEVAKQGKSNEIVGRKLTEKNLAALYLRASRASMKQ